MDPYLEKRAREEAEIRRQIEAELAKQGKAPPEIKKDEPPASVPECGPDYLWAKNSAGILLPWNSSTPNYTTTYGTTSPFTAKSIAATCENMKAALKECYKQIFGYDMPRSGYADEQIALRGYHGRRYEYVWSETLQAHVRIGESLKEKS